VDAWLIYRCTFCDSTWNLPILERRPIRTIDFAFLNALLANEPTLIRRLAFGVEELRRRTGRVEQFDDVLVIRNMLSQCALPPRRLEILCSVPEETGLRVDRLLGNELHLPRSRIQRLEESGGLIVFPKGSRLRRPVRDGMQVVINLSSLGDSGISTVANA
jgi:hypothetical protein